MMKMTLLYLLHNHFFSSSFTKLVFRKKFHYMHLSESPSWCPFLTNEWMRIKHFYRSSYIYILNIITNRNIHISFTLATCLILWMNAVKWNMLTWQNSLIWMMYNICWLIFSYLIVKLKQHFHFAFYMNARVVTVK